ncbi:MAG: molybdate ABC transporter substrate-binding protein [Cyanobacteria bacterium P01_E01_bin.45]
MVTFNSLFTTRRWLLIAAASTVLAACGSTSPSATLLVSVAASLQDVMQELEPNAREYLQQLGYGPVSLTFNFGGSGTLQRQIVQGAPTDVFVSAAERQMDALQAANLVLETSRRTVARNRLALVIPTAATDVELGTFQDLITDRVRTVAIAQPDIVPAGQYARETLEHLGLWEPLTDKLVFGRDVRQVLSYVDTGNVDAGVVFITDATLSDRARVVEIANPSWHAPIRYPAAAIAASQHSELAQAFVEFLTTQTALAVFKSYGFRAP